MFIFCLQQILTNYYYLDKFVIIGTLLLCLLLYIGRMFILNFFYCDNIQVVTKSSQVSFFCKDNLMVLHFCLSLIFQVKQYHIRNFIATNRLCLLINIMLIIMFVLTYDCFSIFLRVYCNVMLTTIKKMKIKLYFSFK